ncbi:hypothetical protein SAMN06264849_10680 [Melghirimyces algeriensis]|uniref:Uncharacterized protein n=1 Tax=Melghirimyces algeriensis TaxID=910412 RepID=A0A521DJ20_9BACL|nr:hypothetical protein SAMN06264849_10680 [Melghirimyces algeriensis]
MSSYACFTYGRPVTVVKQMKGRNQKPYGSSVFFCISYIPCKLNSIYFGNAKGNLFHPNRLDESERTTGTSSGRRMRGVLTPHKSDNLTYTVGTTGSKARGEYPPAA